MFAHELLGRNTLFETKRTKNTGNNGLDKHVTLRGIFFLRATAQGKWVLAIEASLRQQHGHVRCDGSEWSVGLVGVCQPLQHPSAAHCFLKQDVSKRMCGRLFTEEQIHLIPQVLGTSESVLVAVVGSTSASWPKGPLPRTNN
jgi:hypothetical protein